MIGACLVALASSLALHVTTLLGATYDGKQLFYGGMGATLAICVPAALLSGQGGPDEKTPAARVRQRIISVVLSVSVIYVVALGLAVMTPEQRASMSSGESVSLWRGERSITVAQARMLTAFPMPFFAACALILWDRIKREAEAL